MGFDSDRVVVSSRALSISVERKPDELECFSSGNQKHLRKDAANATESHFSLCPRGGKSEEKMPITSFRSSKNWNSWKLKYDKGGKDFEGFKLMENSQVGFKSNGSLNVKTRTNLEIGSDTGKNGTLGVKSNGVSNLFPNPPLSSRLDSRKRVKHLLLNSAVLKQEMGSVGIDGNLLNENFNKTEAGAVTPRDPKTQNILSFGNIYRGCKNFTDFPHQKDAQTNRMVSIVNSNALDCKVSSPIQSSNNVLGFGGGNYGHGSVVKGAKNVENLIRANCSVVVNKNRGENQNLQTPSMVPHFESVAEIKNAGNEEYRRGHFMEAISLYDRAIALSPRNATFHNNKAAAFAALGCYTKAVGEWLEAIDCDPSYSHAHYRLGSLYTRLGRVEDAKWHFKLSGQELGSESIKQLLRLETHLMNVRKARNIENWDLVLIESTLAIEAGADASHQVLAFKAEALLKLHKAEEALQLLIVARKSAESKSRKAYKKDSCLLIIESQVYLYLGRFNEGVIAAERAANLDTRPESLMWLRKARAVADTRKTGNEYVKTEKYLEACMAYGQGLEYASTNSVLLCNRAACRSKLGQWEMAVDDCNAALKYRPNYTKALLQRAYSNARLERWEESLSDYAKLSQEMPGDPGITHSLLQVQMELKRAQGAGA